MITFTTHERSYKGDTILILPFSVAGTMHQEQWFYRRATVASALCFEGLKVRWITWKMEQRYGHIHGWVQDCGISIAKAMEIPQACTQPLISSFQPGLYECDILVYFCFIHGFLFNHYLFLTWWCYKLVFNGNISNTSIIMNLFSPEEWVTSVQFWSNNTILPNYILRVFCKRWDSLHYMQWSNMSHLKTHMHADWPNVILSVG